MRVGIAQIGMIMQSILKMRIVAHWWSVMPHDCLKRKCNGNNYGQRLQIMTAKKELELPKFGIVWNISKMRIVACWWSVMTHDCLKEKCNGNNYGQRLQIMTANKSWLPKKWPISPAKWPNGFSNHLLQNFERNHRHWVQRVIKSYTLEFRWAILFL